MAKLIAQNTKTICIITVVCNAKPYLEKTILNVIEQKETNKIKFIVIDGGSTDGSLDIIKKHRQHIDYWVSEPDKGIYDAMNKGWLQATNDSYILFLGCGDRIIILPNDNTFKTNPDVIIGTVNVNDKETFISKHDFRLKMGNTIHHQAMLVKKCCYPSAPFNIRYKIYADFDFNQQLLKLKKKFVFDPQFTSYMMEAGASKDLDIQEMLSIVNKNYGAGWKTLGRLYLNFQKIRRKLKAK